MIPLEYIAVCIGMLISMSFGYFVVAPRASMIVLQRFGLVKVFQDGEVLYAVQGPDGKPVKIPIGTKEVDGKTQIVEGYAPLAWTLPYIAGQHAVLGIKNMAYGKAGKMKQQAEDAILEGMPVEQASAAIAMKALAKGEIGKAFMAWMAPAIKKKLSEQMGMRTDQQTADNPQTAGGGQKGSVFRPGGV